MNINRLSFAMSAHSLEFDTQKRTLLCRTPKGGTLWIKRLNDISEIDSVSENDSRFFLACGIDEVSGKFIALEKEDGAAAWLIEGRAMLNVIYREMLYLIFIDVSRKYFFIQIDSSDGSMLWHHTVAEDLANYSINGERIFLEYVSGKTECLSTKTGKLRR